MATTRASELETPAQLAGVLPVPIETLAHEPSARLDDFLDALRRNRRAAMGVALLLFFGIVAIIAPWVAPYSATAVNSVPYDLAPSWSHWLGTTHLGQDVFSQLLVGSRASIAMAVGAGLIATLISCVFGLIAGYLRGWVDDTLSLFTNVMLVIPTLPMLIVVEAYANQFNVKGVVVETLVIAATSWAWGARVLRSQMLSLRQNDYVIAARVVGESSFRTIWDEILPNMVSLVVANFIGATLYALTFSVALEFLGLGDISQVSWGSMLYWAEAGQALYLDKWYWFVPPGFCIALFGTGLIFTNYAIDEISNPRLRTERISKKTRELRDRMLASRQVGTDA